MSEGSGGPAGSPVRGLDALRTMLDTAGRLVATLARDPLLKRLLAAFEAIPPGERETILGILEREVAMRRADVDGSGTLLGMHSVRPNPNARLYIRVLDSDTADVPFVAVDELIMAITRAARVMHRAIMTTPHTGDSWKERVLAAFEALPPEEREAVAFCLRVALGLIDQIDARRAGTGP